ncbi:MAG: LPS assembly protein LptD [Nitrospira sp.]
MGAGLLRRLGVCLFALTMLSAALPSLSLAKTKQLSAGSAGSGGAASPVDVTANRIDYRQDQEIYEADGAVVIQQGTMRLTADHVTIESLPGIIRASGHVHLTDPLADVTTERMDVNINTEAGVITHGQLYVPRSNTLVSGRLLQRFSEYHYRVKEGDFTNCDAQDGEMPAWRFRFDDMDLNVGDTLALKGAWLCVADVPVLPIPTITYPLSNRRTGFLVPQVGYDSRFGTHLQDSFYWAINPSQDLTIAPSYYSNLGYGSDLEYRYVIDRLSRGQWYVSYLQQTNLPNVAGVDQNSSDVKRARALIAGQHTQQFTDTLLFRANASFVTDPNYLQQLSNSGTQRALPSNETNLLLNQRLRYGNAYMLGQYLQPLQSGGKDTFQRLPETGYSLPNTSVFGSPLLFGMEGDFVNFYREEGFTLNRVNVVPGLSTDVIDFGHVLGITPQAKFREVYYTRGAQSEDALHRETFWTGVDARSKLSRRFGLDGGSSLLHTIEPTVMYEYVPGTDQSKIAQIDQIDDLPKKNLVTYALRNRFLESDGNSSFNWLDLTVAQSYHVGGVQTLARDFSPTATPLLGTVTQPLQPATVAIQGRKFSDIWMRAVIGNTAPQVTQAQMAAPAFGRGAGSTGGQRPPINQYLTVDAFFDPYRGELSQWNTDLRLQEASNWYVEIGQRYSRDGNRVRRGDLWNPISFNEVYAPTQEIQFATAGGGFRTPWGWTIGAKGYYDMKSNKSPEYDVVALYQNPCKCWSLGLFYLQFPDRAQYNFMFNFTGIGWTENFGTQVMRSILTPLLWGERGLPWASPTGPYGRPDLGASTGGPFVR